MPLIRFLTFGNGEVVVCNSPDSFKEVLQTKCYSFRKSDFFRRLTKEIVGHGLVTSRLPFAPPYLIARPHGVCDEGRKNY